MNGCHRGSASFLREQEGKFFAIHKQMWLRYFEARVDGGAVDKSVLEFLTALVSLLTALVSVHQLHKQRQRESALPTQFFFPDAASPHQNSEAASPGAARPSAATYNPIPVPPNGPRAFGESSASQTGAGPMLFKRVRPESWAAARDAGLIFAASAFVGFLLALAGYVELTTLAAVNVVSLLIGLTVAASRARGNRARHLFLTGVFIWALSLLNVLLGVGSVASWFGAAVLIALCGTVSGLLSLVFRPRRPVAAPQ